MYKRDQSTWECKECYVTNKKDDTLCAACQHPKDGIAQPASAKPSSFGASGGTSFNFSANSAVGTTASTTSWSFGVPATTATAFSFGMPTYSTVASTGATTAVNSSQDGTPSAPVFSFGNSQSQKSESGGLLFGNSGLLFGDKSTPPSKGAGNTAESIPEKKSVADLNVSIFGGTGGNSLPKSGQGTSEYLILFFG